MPTKPPARRRPPQPPFAGKGDPRNGRGPAKGAPNAGRPPDWWLLQLRSGLYRPETIEQVNTVLANAKHPHFPTVLKWADERVHGKVSQQITGADGGPLVVQVLRFGEVEVAF